MIISRTSEFFGIETWNVSGSSASPSVQPAARRALPGGSVASGQFAVTGGAVTTGHTLDIYQGSTISVTGAVACASGGTPPMA